MLDPDVNFVFSKIAGSFRNHCPYWHVTADAGKQTKKDEEEGAGRAKKASFRGWGITAKSVLQNLSDLSPDSAGFGEGAKISRIIIAMV